MLQTITKKVLFGSLVASQLIMSCKHFGQRLISILNFSDSFIQTV